MRKVRVVAWVRPVSQLWAWLGRQGMPKVGERRLVSGLMRAGVKAGRVGEGRVAKHCDLTAGTQGPPLMLDRVRIRRTDSPRDDECIKIA